MAGNDPKDYRPEYLAAVEDLAKAAQRLSTTEDAISACFETAYVIARIESSWMFTYLKMERQGDRWNQILRDMLKLAREAIDDTIRSEVEIAVIAERLRVQLVVIHHVLDQIESINVFSR